MSGRRYDIVVFGATGFTGQRVVTELVSAGARESWNIAVAGRDALKLEKLVAERGNGAPLEVIVADVRRPESLLAMAKSTRLVLACVGPYRYHGEPVVQACVEAGTDYLDISGEPEFIETMEYKYQDAAQAAGCYIASAAGFDSVPADMGTLYVARKFTPPAVPHSVDSYLTVHARNGLRAHYPTWESLVMGMAHANELRALRKRALAEGKAAKQPKLTGPKPERATGAAYNDTVGAFAVPFPGADASVVKRTQAALAARGQPAVHYAAYMTVPSRWVLFLIGFFGAILQKLANSSFGRALLLTYPGLFSYGVFTKKGPSEKELQGTSFTMTYVAKGYSQGAPTDTAQKPDRQIVARMVGPELGYVATPIFLVQAAFALLSERDRLQLPGGVYTVGALLGGTNYLERLQKSGIQLTDISDKRV
ncbi:hypothetical protein WJX72_002324 [[Myrmecia] bisecta]|uniref:Saccharopine dehydrogenase NADP binding domain-containing protein n=1 Tax=[Myrmecia] bisecta TaxID=41462 RepID=A0AAW1Q8C5_9CHLO